MKKITTDFNSRILRSEIHGKSYEFKRTFTTNGIGYTFNSEPFWDIFQNTSTNQDFYSEMQSKSINESQTLYYPRGTGPNDGLRMVFQFNDFLKTVQDEEPKNFK